MLSKFWSSSNKKKAAQIEERVSVGAIPPINRGRSSGESVSATQYLADRLNGSLPHGDSSATAVAEHEIMKQDFLTESEYLTPPVATDDPEAWYSQGNLYRNAGKLDVALACYNKTIELQPHGQEVVGFWLGWED
jgi:tetratricopeptide (TPR) repeat protein